MDAPELIALEANIASVISVTAKIDLFISLNALERRTVWKSSMKRKSFSEKMKKTDLQTPQSLMKIHPLI